MALRKLLKNSIYIIVLRLNVVAKLMILIIKGLLRIFYPNSPEDGKPENILKIVKEWRRSQGLPLFKDSE